MIKDSLKIDELDIKIFALNEILNLLDEKYETARDYSQLGRSFNLGFKKNY